MSDRPSRGTSWSSNCFQTSSAFGFLFFMFRSRARRRGCAGGEADLGTTGAKRDDSPGVQNLKNKDLTQRSQRPLRSPRMRRKKKKGETAVEPQIHPRSIIPKLKRFASPNFNSPNFRKFCAPGPGNTDHAPSCYAALT